MNGGFALKLQLERRTLERALSALAESEGLRLVTGRPESLDGLEFGWAPMRLVFRLFAHADGLVLTAPRSSREEKTLTDLGAGLARHTRAPMALVLDSDEGSEVVRRWRGGQRLSANTGFAAFADRAPLSTIEFKLARHARLPRTAELKLLTSLNATRPASLREINARFTGARRREKSGHLVAEETVLRLDFEGGARFVAVEARARFRHRALEHTLEALDHFKFPAAVLRTRTPMSMKDLSAVRAGLPLDLKVQSIERQGPPGFLFTQATYWVLASRGGKSRRFKVEGPQPKDQRPFALKLAEHIVAAVDGRKAMARRRLEQALESSYVEQLKAGDLEASAHTYARLYFSNLDERVALPRAREKIAELAVLYGVKRSPS